MEIKKSGSQPSGRGQADYFTGSVRIDPLFDAPEPARVFGASVTFEPGARTAWHTHPLGQTLIVTSGCGLAQRVGGPIEEIHAGDIVWFPPGEKHWHGAMPTIAMTHIAIVEKLDGKTADWLEKVRIRPKISWTLCDMLDITPLQVRSSACEKIETPSAPSVQLCNMPSPSL